MALTFQMGDMFEYVEMIIISYSIIHLCKKLLVSVIFTLKSINTSFLQGIKRKKTSNVDNILTVLNQVHEERYSSA